MPFNVEKGISIQLVKHFLPISLVIGHQNYITCFACADMTRIRLKVTTSTSSLSKVNSNFSNVCKSGHNLHWRWWGWWFSIFCTNGWRQPNLRMDKHALSVTFCPWWLSWSKRHTCLLRRSIWRRQPPLTLLQHKKAASHHSCSLDNVGDRCFVLSLTARHVSEKVRDHRQSIMHVNSKLFGVNP